MSGFVSGVLDARDARLTSVRSGTEVVVGWVWGVSGVLVGHSGGPGEGVGMPVFRQPVTCALDSTETQPHGIEKRHW